LRGRARLVKPRLDHSGDKEFPTPSDEPGV
jgi:hypothetical protein